MTTGWSLERELCKAAGVDSIGPALIELGVLGRGERLEEWREITTWQRSGAESYLYRFEVVASSGRSISLLLKAFVPFPGPVSLEEGLEELLRRRRILADRGINVPRAYYSGNGLIVEDFIPYALSDIIERLTQERASYVRMLAHLLFYAAVLDELGFVPVEAFDDLRCDGRRVYVVDFGEDLGPPNLRNEGTVAQRQLFRWLEKMNSSPPPDVLEEAKQVVKGLSEGS